MPAPWGLLAFAVVVGALALGARLAWPRLDRGARRALVVACVLAAPIAFAGVVMTYRTLLARHGIADAGDVALLLAAPTAAWVALVVAAARAPWRGAWWGLVAAPFLAFFAFGSSPASITDSSWENLRWPTAVLAAAAIYPHAVAHSLKRPVAKARWAPGAVAALALALLFPSALAMSVFPLVEGSAFTQAEHSWRARLEPADPSASYEVVVPFLSAQSERGLASLAGVERSLRVEEGDATVTLDREMGVVRVVARGPVTLAASHAFYGAIGARESFHDYEVRNPEATLVRTEPDTTVHLTWSVDLSGGGGHTCWGSATHEVDLRGGEPTALLRAERAWSTVCA